MAAVYCAERDLYDHGIPRGSVPNPARLVASALASTDAIVLDEHGFATDDQVFVRAQGATGALPAPLVAGTPYYVIRVSEFVFKLAAAPAGGPIDLTSDGFNVLVYAPLPFAEAIAWASRLIDDMLPAHVVPLSAPVPELVRFTCAELAAWKLSARGGPTSKSLGEIVDAARKRLERWATGVPVRGENEPPAANLATSAAAPARAGDWSRFGGIS